MINAERLRSFVAVATEGGFSKAARAMGVTQSSVSQSISALERELGERLFDRARRGARITEAGRVLLGHAENVFDELERAEAALAALRALTAGRLRVGTSDTLATYVLPPVLGELRRRHPQVELQLINRPSPVVAELVADGSVDLGVISTPLPWRVQHLEVSTLLPQHDVAICHPAHRLAGWDTTSFASIAEEPLLALDRSTGSRAFLEAHFAVCELRPRVVMEMTSVEVLKRLVQLDFGVAVVPEIAVATEVAMGTLVALDINDLFDDRAVALVLPTKATLSPATRAFAALCRETLFVDAQSVVR